MVAGAALVVLPAPAWVAVTGMVVIGLAAAPMFPLLTLTTRARVGSDHTDRAVGVQVAASALGSATLPALVGLVINGYGAQRLAPCLLVLAVAMAGGYALAAHGQAGRRGTVPEPVA
jgi:fucose permease